MTRPRQRRSTASYTALTVDLEPPRFDTTLMPALDRLIPSSLKEDQKLTPTHEGQAEALMEEVQNIAPG
ncbi:hypothetical protein JCM21900_002452 [Sporobolomyces salmonicolor]